MERNLSQEAHLWYTVSSPDYIAQAKVKLQEATTFMRERVLKHPFIADYAPVPYWGGVMQDLLDRFDGALAILRHGEFDPMEQWASQMQDIPRGFRESNMEWLTQADQDTFLGLLNDTYSICSRFSDSILMSNMYSSDGYKDRSADWHYEMPEDMGYESNDIARYSEKHIFPVLPQQIPEYAPDTSVSCKTGDIVPWTGVWVPSTGMGTAALAFARKNVQIMQPAYEIASRDEDGYATFTLVDCLWHPVKPTGRMIDHPAITKAKYINDQGRLRCEAGQPCPQAGYWFTPASAGSRRSFAQGELMPEFKSSYGLTIWQWDDNQS
jgi:hypothetical protein